MSTEIKKIWNKNADSMQQQKKVSFVDIHPILDIEALMLFFSIKSHKTHWCELFFKVGEYLTKAKKVQYYVTFLKVIGI